MQAGAATGHLGGVTNPERAPRVEPLSGAAVLVAAPVAWRDACFAVPAVRAIGHARPGAVLGVVCPEQQVELWQGLEIGHLVSYPEGASARRIAAGLRDGGADWWSAVLWEAGPVADACARLAIPERLGPAAAGLGKRLTRVVETPAPAAAVPAHRVRQFLDFLDELAIEAFVPRNFAAPPAPADRDPAALVLAPDSDFGPASEWIAECWVELARRLSEAGPRSLTVLGMAGGRGLGRAVAAELGEAAVFREVTSPGQSIAVLAAHGFCVSADSSLAHLASHVGCRCVTLFGPGDPIRLRPLGPLNRVVRQHVECAPCLLRKCPLDLRCQRELTVLRVVETVVLSFMAPGPL